ncbi:MAG: hypothetical protein ACE5FU_08090, partial [Nitrospinota bacterium]
SWVPSNPTKIMFRNLSSRHTSSSPNKVVSANFEIDFGNNLAVFQELRSNTGETKDQIDNVVTPDTAILSFEQGWEFAMGGTGNLDRISGIYTGESKIRVEYCLDATLSNCAGIWKNLGIPATDDGNGTFLLGPTTTTTLPASSNCFYTDATIEFPGLPTIVLDTMFSGYHFRIVEIADSDACS